jgi:hypothetical protein
MANRFDLQPWHSCRAPAEAATLETAVQIKRTWRRSMGERAPWLPCCASRSNSALTWEDGLRAFSDNVRDRRLLWAEERAKMVGPLSLFIFPVILGIAMLPGIIRLITVLK